jgi:hypothetical protein
MERCENIQPYLAKFSLHSASEIILLGFIKHNLGDFL